MHEGPPRERLSTHKEDAVSWLRAPLADLIVVVLSPVLEATSASLHFQMVTSLDSNTYNRQKNRKNVDFCVLCQTHLGETPVPE